MCEFSFEMEGPAGSDGQKRARGDSNSFISAHHEKAEMSWDQERQLRLSCELRHLRYRHVDDLCLVLQKAGQKFDAVTPAVLAKLESFSKRDNVDPALVSALKDAEQVAYAKRLSVKIQDLRWRYAGDLAQIIEHLVEQKLIEESFVTGELQRINISQSDARKKLRKPGNK